MSEKNLGLPFDIHGGGIDLIFPHHENEIAQSCGAYGHGNDPQFFAKYWIHNGLLDFDGEKMSKSLGNILYVHDLVKEYPGEVLRLALLSGHYRQPLNWTDDTIEQARSILDRLYRVLNKVKDIESSKELLNGPPSKVLEALCDDLNTSKALAELNEIAGKLSTCSSDEASDLKAQLQASANVLGILQQSPEEWLGIGQTGDDIDKNKVESLIKEREEA